MRRRKEAAGRHGRGEALQWDSLGFLSSSSSLLIESHHVLFAVVSCAGGFLFVATWRSCVSLTLVLNGLAESRGEHGRHQHINHEKGWKSIGNNFSPKSPGNGLHDNNLQR